MDQACQPCYQAPKKGFRGGAISYCRYFWKEDVDGEFAGLRPGHLTLDLREALRIGPADPPPWLGRMRKLGYPPGFQCVCL